MSNPSVITLSSLTMRNGDSFRVEDNLGECIHIHYGNFRLDLTIAEFNLLCDDLALLLKEYIDVEGFDLDDIDSVFLDSISHTLPELERIEHSQIKLGALKVFVKKFGLSVLRPLSASRIVRALEGDTDDYKSYAQENMPFASNLERLETLKDSVDSGDVPKAALKVTLFNDQDIVRDGQHRASIQLKKFGPNHVINTTTFWFNDKKFSLSRHPWTREVYRLPFKIGYQQLRRMVHYLRYLKRKFS